MEESQLQRCLTGVISDIPSRLKAYEQLSAVTQKFPLLNILKNPQRIFSFPKPKEDSDIGQEYDIFIQKDEIIKSITTNSVSRIKHNISLNDESINSLIAILGNFGNMIDFPNRFGEALRTQLYNSGEDIERLKKWLGIINQFIKADIKSIDEFIRVVPKETLPPKFSHFFEEINEFQLIANFTSKVTSRLPIRQRELIARSCGQNLGDTFSTILKNVESEFDTRIQLLEGKINQQQADSRFKELEKSLNSSEKQQQALQGELNELREHAEQSWWTSFTKGFKRICDGISEVISCSGTFLHNAIFGEKEE